MCTYYVLGTMRKYRGKVKYNPFPGRHYQDVSGIVDAQVPLSFHCCVCDHLSPPTGTHLVARKGVVFLHLGKRNVCGWGSDSRKEGHTFGSQLLTMKQNFLDSILKVIPYY